jgi:hypothetical protein
MEATARVLGFGAKKYADHNWRGGFKWTRLVGALMRHTLAFLGGQDLDPETGLPHLDHAACCIMFLQELYRTRKDLDDRYHVPEVQHAGHASPLRDASVTIEVAVNDPDRFVTAFRNHNGPAPEDDGEAFLAEDARQLDIAAGRLPAPEPELHISEVDENAGPTAFTPQEEQWFRTGEPLRMPKPQPPVEELARCNDPHCQMCPLELANEHPLMRAARTSRGG